MAMIKCDKAKPDPIVSLGDAVVGTGRHAFINGQDFGNQICGQFALGNGITKSLGKLPLIPQGIGHCQIQKTFAFHYRDIIQCGKNLLGIGHGFRRIGG